MNTTPIYILAANYNEASGCASSNLLQKRDWRFIRDATSLAGLNKVTIWLSSGFNTRRDLGEIFFRLHLMKPHFVTKITKITKVSSYEDDSETDES